MWLPPKIFQSALLKPSLCKSILILSSPVATVYGLYECGRVSEKAKKFLFTAKLRLGLVSTQLRIQRKEGDLSGSKATKA